MQKFFDIIIRKHRLLLYSNTCPEYHLAFYHKALKGEGIKVCAVDPGLNATNLVDAVMVREKRGSEPDVRGALVVEVVEGKRDEEVRGYLCGEGVRAW